MHRALLFLLLALPLCGQRLDLVAPHPQFAWVNQENGPGNSCGPASLLNAFGSGSQRWQGVYQRVPGTIDQGRLNSVIKIWALRDSLHLPGRKRWQDRRGISLNDLTDIANEMASLERTPALKSELLFTTSSRPREKTLRHAHKRMAKSLKNGLPPILSVRRFVYRDGQWQGIQGHFVTLIALPARLPRGATSLPLRYLDPVGGRVLDAQLILTDTSPSAPCLILRAPGTSAGKHLVRGNEPSHLGLAAILGCY
ncbi:MAG: hypothetical protein Q7Q71_02290 [Verrucomicrobiota bacterium JB023]|nr:hypothetical protein [Verrucomicrobiota bacterium JB023]